MKEDAKKYPGRPRRLAQVFHQDTEPLYYVTITTWRRSEILDNEIVCNAFKAHGVMLLSRNIGLGRYVIMPDHIHFFVRIGVGEKLGLTVKHLKEKITKALRADGYIQEVWQDGFFDHLMRSDESYREKWDYVVMNPVRADLVKELKDWPYQGEICLIDRA